MKITKSQLKVLLKKDESPVLEFKRGWYWNDSTPQPEMANKWGEFLKDIISLSNGYLRCVGTCRYLVIGFSESTQEVHDIGIQQIKLFNNLKKFKKTLIQKLEGYTQPAFINIDVELMKFDEKEILIFEIPSPGHITELKKELKTKTRVLDSGAVIIRKGQKSDEVRQASPSEYEQLNLEFKKYSESDSYHSFLKIENKPEAIQERSIEKTVQLYIDQNSSYSIALNYPVKVKNWVDGIIYEVYKLVEDFGTCREFIYIHNNSNQGKTLGDIKQSNVVDNLSKAIILIDKPKIKDIEKRKANIKQVFGTSYVYFIDEFGYEYLYKDCILKYQKYNLPIYVDSLYDGDLSAFERLKEWFDSENEPLFIVNGHGGIGKTTLAKQFLDYVHDESSDTGILFIDSKEIIDELSRNTSKKNKIKDVYDFYRAQMAVVEDDSSHFSKELLKLSMDNGSLIIVLDGIDEVIAKLGDKFDVESFIASIFKEYSSDLNRTKILITCRDHFWNEIGKKILLPEITLKAFSGSLAQEFFSQYLQYDSRKIERAMELAKGLAIEETSDSSSNLVFIPFLLDMIGYLIKTKNENFSTHGRFKSPFLLDDNHTDFLIAKVCEREVIKLDSLSIDNQIELFIRIATTKENGVSLYDIKSELSLILGKNIDNSLIEKIKGHPLLICSDNSIFFRYDVFNIYFKALYLVSFLRKMDVNDFEEKTSRIIIGYLKYDSSFTDSLCERINFNDDLVIFCIEIIEKVKNTENVEQDSVISAILALLLTLLQVSNERQSNIDTRTELIDKLFGEGVGVINGLCIVDIFGESNTRPTFDFKDKFLTNCTFNNYEYFWECSTNKNTRFDNSFFSDIDPRNRVNVNVWKDMFLENCNTSSIQHLLNKNEEEEAINKNKILDELVKVFRLFYERGNFYPQKQGRVRAKLFAVKLLPALLEKKVVLEFKDPKKPTMKQFKINNKYQSVINYIEQGSESAELFRLADDLAE